MGGGAAAAGGLCDLSVGARYVILDFIGEQCAAIITSNRYAGYAFIKPARRQVCWAHPLRDFNRVGQRSRLAGRIGQRLLGPGFVMFRRRDRAQLVGDKLDPLTRRVRAALEQSVQQSRCIRNAKICANILNLWPALWTFTTSPAIAPTNNAVDQALRRIVRKRKISGPTRSRRGDPFIARGFTAHESCLRQGRDLWHFLHDAVSAWIANPAPPSLIPRPVAALAPSD